MKYCHKCKTPWEEKREPPPKESCLKCGADLHVCTNCRFYEPAKSNACAVDGLEPVIDKTRFNFCEEFSFRDKTQACGASEAAKAKTAFENLFKKPIN